MFKCQMCNGTGQIGAGRERRNCTNCGGSGEVGDE